MTERVTIASDGSGNALVRVIGPSPSLTQLVDWNPAVMAEFVHILGPSCSGHRVFPGDAWQVRGLVIAPASKR
jgi:hypothetical protein